MAHATPLYRGAGYVEQISWSPCSALLYLSSQPASRRAEPIVCLLTCGPACQWKRKRTHWTYKSFTSTCWWWKTNPIKIFSGRFWSYSRVVRFYLQFNSICTSRGFNYHSIFLHDTTWMLDVPCVGKRRKNSTKSSPHLDRRSRKHGKPYAYTILRTSPPHAVMLSPYFSASVRHLALVDLTRTNYWLALCDVATSYYYGCWLYYYGTNTPRSESKTIYKLSLWHAYANVPFITYNKSSTHNDNEDTL